MRRGYILSKPTRLVHGIRKVLTGEFVMIGLNDGGDDREELTSTFENLGIVMTLLLGII